MAGYWVFGLWVPKVTHYFLVSVPIIIVATLVGRLLSRRLDVAAVRTLHPRWPDHDRCHSFNAVGVAFDSQ